MLLAMAFSPAVHAEALENEETTELSEEIEQLDLGDISSFAESSSEESWTILWYLDHDNNIGVMPLYVTLGLVTLLYFLEVFIALIPFDNIKVVTLFDGVISGLHRMYLELIESIISLPQSIKDMIEPLMKVIDCTLPGDSFLLEFSSLSLRLLDDRGAVIPESGEVNMGDPETLENFLTWGIEAYPADNVMVILMDHGGGWRGICVDNSVPGNADLLTPSEVGQAFKAAYEQTGRKIDMLAIEACEMGALDFVYEVRDYVDHFAGSEETMLAMFQFLYLPILLQLGLDPGMDMGELGQVMSLWNILGLLLGGISGYKTTYSSFDTDKLGDLTESVDALAQALMEKMDTYHEEIWDARLKTRNYMKVDSWQIVDLYDLAKNLYEEIDDEEISAICVDVMEGVEEAVTSNMCLPGDASHGISIFFPLNYGDEFMGDLFGRYSATSFAQETQWDEFLSEAMEFYPYDDLWIGVPDLALQLVPMVNTYQILPSLISLLGGGIWGLIKTIFTGEFAVIDEALEGAEAGFGSLEDLLFELSLPLSWICYLILQPIAWIADWLIGWIPVIGEIDIADVVVSLMSLIITLVLTLLMTYIIYIVIIVDLVWCLPMGFLNDFPIVQEIVFRLVDSLLFIPNQIIELIAGLEQRIFEAFPPPW
jgi:hypothetical protein